MIIRIIIIKERHATFPSNICIRCLSCKPRLIRTSFALHAAAPSPSRQPVSHLRTGHWLNPLLQEACSNEHTRYTVESIEIYSAFLGTASKTPSATRRRSQEDNRVVGEAPQPASHPAGWWWWWWPHLDCGPCNNNNTKNNNNVHDRVHQLRQLLLQNG